jgi:hypothetical protein
VSDGPAISRLTDRLLAPAGAVDVDAVRRAADPIAAELSALAAHAVGSAGGGRGLRRGGRLIRLTGHDVRVALGGDSTPRIGNTGPFMWSMANSRRALGLIALRDLLDGRVRSPEDGVRAAVAGALRDVRTEQRGVSSMDRWLAGLPAAARAAVGAEAITWATRLWCALDWDAFEVRPVIGRDHWWDSAAPSALALRSRAEVRTAQSHLVVLGGMRRSTIGAELSVTALIETLRAPRQPPCRVVGWWPESGHITVVDVDPSVLERAVAAVARTLNVPTGQAAA